MSTSLRRNLSDVLSGDVPELGTLCRVSQDGKPFVEYQGSRGERLARCLGGAANHLAPAAELAGASVLLLFERGDRALPIIVGFVHDTLQGAAELPRPAGETASGAPASRRMEGASVLIEAEQTIELRCGQGSIVLNRDGHIIIKGQRVTSRARETNKVRGAVVLIN
jgi:hypothetical protein